MRALAYFRAQYARARGGWLVNPMLMPRIKPNTRARGAGPLEALRGTEGRKIPARPLDSAACNSVYTCFTVSVSPCAFHGASAMALLIAMVVAMFIVPLLRCCACIGVFLAKNPGGWVFRRWFWRGRLRIAGA